MSNRNFDFSAIVKILNAQNNANFYNRQQTVVQRTPGIPYTIDLHPANPLTGNYDADTIATLQSGQQAYYFKGVPDTTVLSPQQYPMEATVVADIVVELPPAPILTGAAAGSVPGTLDISYFPAIGVLPPITNYAYSTNNGSSFTVPSIPSATNPFRISGLSPGTTYQVILKAISANGTSLPSNMVSGTA